MEHFREKLCDLFAPGRFGLRLFLFGLGVPFLGFGLDEHPQRNHAANNERDRHGGRRAKGQLVSLNGFLEAVQPARRAGDNGFVVEVAGDVRGQAVRGFVTTRAILLQAFHHDPVQVAAECVNQFLQL